MSVTKSIKLLILIALLSYSCYKLGYRTCVNCSTTELYSYIPIIGNKQVLELQIVSQELSAAVHKSWRRK